MWVVLKQVRSVSCTDRRIGTEPHEEIKEDDDLLTEEVLKLYQSAVARFNFLRHGKARLFVFGEGTDAKSGLTTRQRSH